MTTKELDKMIKKSYFDKEFGLKPILDGIINEDLYFKSNCKILWILKEPYDLYTGQGGWDMRVDMLTNLQSYSKHPIWRRIGIVSSAILNNLQYEKAKNKIELFELSLKSIAMINVSKNPANKTSNNRWSFFRETYKIQKNVLLNQIDYCNPDIIIGGNMINFFKYDLNISESEKKFDKIIHDRLYYENKQRLIVDAYHPACTRNGEEHFNGVTELCKKWYSTR